MAEMTLLRRRMIEDMKVRNLSPATQRCYVHAVAKFAQHFNRSLDRIGLGRTSLAGGAQQCLVLENRRLALRYDRLGFIVQSLLQAACLFLVAGRLAREF